MVRRCDDLVPLPLPYWYWAAPFYLIVDGLHNFNSARSCYQFAYKVFTLIIGIKFEEDQATGYQGWVWVFNTESCNR